MPQDTHSLLVVADSAVAEVAEALEAVAATLGWTTTVADDLDQVHAALPTADSVVVLSHEHGLDGPALAAALAGSLGYIGAMGSRRTQERRRRWMTEHGISDAEQERIHGPAGLDIRADTPAEIAVAILAEVIGVRHGAGGGALRDRPGPIHPDLAPGESYCPAEPAR
jgi:xanthine dehydrogenase accessory factor